MLILDSHLFGSFAAVKLHKGSTALATVARMITLAKLIELGHCVFKVWAIKVSEDYGKLSLQLFEVTESPEERRDDMILALS